MAIIFKIATHLLLYLFPEHHAPCLFHLQENPLQQ
jgi:hypothetical protein